MTRFVKLNHTSVSVSLLELIKSVIKAGMTAGEANKEAKVYSLVPSIVSCLKMVTLNKKSSVLGHPEKKMFEKFI